jgi:hypothetical protein
MSNNSGLGKSALEQTLANMELLRDAKRKELAIKKREYERLENELRAAGTALHNISGSILSLRQDLGLEESEPILTMQDARPADAEQKDGTDQTRAAMLVVARYHDRGGLPFEHIHKILHDEGVDVDREYLHTILNRKRTRQGKLAKTNGRWFLTDKGKEEVGMK